MRWLRVLGSINIASSGVFFTSGVLTSDPVHYVMCILVYIFGYCLIAVDTSK